MFEDIFIQHGQTVFSMAVAAILLLQTNVTLKSIEKNQTKILEILRISIRGKE